MIKYTNIRIKASDYKVIKRIKKQTGHSILNIISMFLSGQMKAEGSK